MYIAKVKRTWSKFNRTWSKVKTAGFKGQIFMGNGKNMLATKVKFI